jgi:hypothetical protein
VRGERYQSFQRQLAAASKVSPRGVTRVMGT